MAKNKHVPVGGYEIIDFGDHSYSMVFPGIYKRIKDSTKPFLLYNVVDRASKGQVVVPPAFVSFISDLAVGGTLYSEISAVFGEKVRGWGISVTASDTVYFQRVEYPEPAKAAMTKPATAPEIVDAPMIAEEPEKVLPEQTVKAVKPRKAPTKAIPEQKIETEV